MILKVGETVKMLSYPSVRNMGGIQPTDTMIPFLERRVTVSQVKEFTFKIEEDGGRYTYSVDWIDPSEEIGLVQVKVEGDLKLPSGKSSALDVQVGGGHYKDMKIQPIVFIQENNLGFCEGNAIKYLCRHRSKNGLEDLKKARHYIDLLIEHEYKARP